MYNTISQLLSEASGKSLPEVIMENEIALTGATREEITNGIKNMLSVMKQSAEKALAEPLSMAGN
ncbi:MAG: hypothetical protein RSC38_03900, partial [Oscillospiraceae bacterium]